MWRINEILEFFLISSWEGDEKILNKPMEEKHTFVNGNQEDNGIWHYTCEPHVCKEKKKCSLKIRGGRWCRKKSEQSSCH